MSAESHYALDHYHGGHHHDAVHKLPAAPAGFPDNKQERVKPVDPVGRQSKLHQQPPTPRRLPNRGREEAKDMVDDPVEGQPKLIKQPQGPPNNDQEEAKDQDLKLIYKSLRNKVARGEILSEKERQLYLRYYQQFGGREVGGSRERNFAPQRRMGNINPVNRDKVSHRILS